MSQTPEAGMAAPEFTAADQDGHSLHSKELRGQPLVLYFYPRASTPGCTIEARQFRDAMSEFQRRKVRVIGVSPDSPKAQKKFQVHECLPFPLLADADRAVANAYGVIREKTMYGRLFKGVSRITFLVDGEGVIRRVFDPVKPNGHAAQVLAAIDELGLKG